MRPVTTVSYAPDEAAMSAEASTSAALGTAVPSTTALTNAGGRAVDAPHSSARPAAEARDLSLAIDEAAMRRRIEHGGPLAGTAGSRIAGASRLSESPSDCSSTRIPTIGAMATLGPSESPRALDPAVLRVVARALAAPSDPALFLLELESAFHAAETSERRDRVQSIARTNERTIAAQRLARKRAEKAARRARRCLRGAPRWVRRLVSAVVTAAGVAGAAFTGGASLGLAIAGAVLLHGASAFAAMGRALGMSGAAARWLEFGLRVAGAALMAGAGAASGGGQLAQAGASAGSRAADGVSAIRSVASAVGSTLEAARGARGIGAAVSSRNATDAELDAAGQSVALDRGRAELDSVSDAMRRSLATYRATSEHLTNIAELRRRRDDALVGQIGR